MIKRDVLLNVVRKIADKDKELVATWFLLATEEFINELEDYDEDTYESFMKYLCTCFFPCKSKNTLCGREITKKFQEIGKQLDEKFGDK